jgi:U3 small nucleolar RNA-associated protein 18
LTFKKSFQPRIISTKSTKSHAMPRQRSKKLSSSRKTEEKLAPELEREEEESSSENESVELEKDEEELELDRLVLGDAGAFRVQLGRDIDMEEDLDRESDEAIEKDLEVEVGLEHLDDAEVSDTSPIFQSSR